MLFFNMWRRGDLTEGVAGRLVRNGGRAGCYFLHISMDSALDKITRMQKTGGFS